LAAVDVCYRDDGTAHAACVIFTSPEHVLGEQVLATVEVDVAQVAPYEPGAFFKRELPCILAVLAEARHMIDMVVVDGYVFLEQDAPGLGAKLHETLEGSVAVMGVAKTSFHGGQAVEVLRGASGTPLYVGAVGLDPQAAASLVLKMKGSHRLPDALRRADALSRGNQFQPS
jgi:deoxyribonuclease V